MESNLITVTVPGSKNIPFHLAEEPSSFFTKQMDSEESVILWIARYIIGGVGTILPTSVNMALKHSLNNGAFETLLSGEASGENLIKGFVKIQQTSQRPNITISKVARALLLQSSYAIRKADSLLYAIDNFGIHDFASNAFHGVGYLSSLGLAIKSLLEVTESTEEVEKQQTPFLKKARFGALAGSAIVGFFTTFSTATWLAVASILLSLAIAMLSLASYLYESSVEKDTSEETLIKHCLTIPKFQMV